PADIDEEQGGHEEGPKERRQAGTGAAATETKVEVRAGGTVLRQKTQIQFGGTGLPLSELPNLAARLRGASAPAPVTRPKVGRNEPCPCGSGKKFKKCCGRGATTL